jgi:hypothetical protein
MGGTFPDLILASLLAASVQADVHLGFSFSIFQPVVRLKGRLCVFPGIPGESSILRHFPSLPPTTSC